ncbi:MAG: tetratricopeptide repeat protein [Bacteroidia bacterium]|nr:tetratricopeptide repeat protein [Bacteroidia bacterium]
MRDSNKKEWLLVAFILFVTFLAFLPVLKSDFVYWDDDVNVTINPNVRELNAASIKNIFTNTVVGGYTPLTTLSFAVENRVFGMKPGVFHFNNLLLHLLCTLLVFVLMRKLEMNLFVSLTVTFLFGIHPMRVESVAWITERKDVLYSFFFLLSLISYLTFYKSKRLLFYFLALLAFIFALLSKIQAVSLPLILLLLDYFFENKFRFKQVLDKIPFFILSLVTGLAGIYFLGQQGTLETGTVLPFIQRIFVGTYSFCVYLIKSVLPYQLSAIYPNPVKLSVLFYVSALPVIVLALLIYKSGKYRKELIFGSLFFLLNVMFMLQIVGAGQAFLADRFTYIPYIGLFFLIAWALNFLYLSKWKTYVIITGVIYLAVLGTVTWSRTQVWKNTETLFSDVVKKYPNVSMAFNNMGLYYRDNNQNEKAIAAYGKAIEINPQGFLSYSNRGEAYFDRGEADKALEDMNMAIKLKPDYGKALSNRGAIWGSKKEFDLALRDLDKAIALDAKNQKAYSNRSLVYYSLGNYEKASLDATSYLKINPDDAAVSNLRGLCFGRLNKNQEALSDFNKSIQLNPKAGAYYQNRSSLYYRIGDAKGALKDILKAQELGVKVNPAYLQMLQTK